MSSTPASRRRATFPRSTDYSKPFVKDWDRLSRSGRYDMHRLKEVMLLLVAADGPLGAEWSDHALTGAWAGFRECHVGGDFLLAYRIDRTGHFEAIYFARTGTHADLFE